MQINRGLTPDKGGEMLIDSALEFLRMRLNDLITLKLLDDLRQFLKAKSTHLFKKSTLSNKKYDNNTLHRSMNNKRSSNPCSIKNKDHKERSFQFSNENSKDLKSKNKSKIEVVIQRNPFYVSNLLKSKIESSGLKLKLKTINKNLKRSLSPDLPDNGKATTTKYRSDQGYLQTDINTKLHKASILSVNSSIKNCSRNNNKHIVYSQTQTQGNSSIKKPINLKSLLTTKEKSMNAPITLKSKLNGLTAATFSSGPRPQPTTSKNAQRVSNCSQNEVITLSKIKNAIAVDLQGLLNFSYDEFHNMTSNRLNNNDRYA